MLQVLGTKRPLTICQEISRAPAVDFDNNVSHEVERDISALQQFSDDNLLLGTSQAEWVHSQGTRINDSVLILHWPPPPIPSQRRYFGPSVNLQTTFFALSAQTLENQKAGSPFSPSHIQDKQLLQLLQQTTQ